MNNTSTALCGRKLGKTGGREELCVGASVGPRPAAKKMGKNVHLPGEQRKRLKLLNRRGGHSQQKCRKRRGAGDSLGELCANRSKESFACRIIWVKGLGPQWCKNSDWKSNASPTNQAATPGGFQKGANSGHTGDHLIKLNYLKNTGTGC